VAKWLGYNMRMFGSEHCSSAPIGIVEETPNFFFGEPNNPAESHWPQATSSHQISDVAIGAAENVCDIPDSE